MRRKAGDNVADWFDNLLRLPDMWQEILFHAPAGRSKLTRGGFISPLQLYEQRHKVKNFRYFNEA